MEKKRKRGRPSALESACVAKHQRVLSGDPPSGHVPDFDEILADVYQPDPFDPTCNGRYRYPSPIGDRGVRWEVKLERHRRFTQPHLIELDVWPLDSRTQGAWAFWCRLHGVTKRAGESLRVLNNQKWWDPAKIPLYRNLRAFEQDRFSVMPLYTVKVPSTKPPHEGVAPAPVEVPFHDLFDMLRYLIQFPGNLESMRFGAVHQDGFAKQLWHGAIMRESPLYTFPAFTGRNDLEFFLNDDVAYNYAGAPCLGKIVAICAVDKDDAMYLELSKTKTLREVLRDLRTTKQLMCRIRPYRMVDGSAVDVRLDFDTEHVVLNLSDVLARVPVDWPSSDEKESSSSSSGRRYRCTEGLVTTRHACEETPTQEVLPIDECPSLPVRAYALCPSSLKDHPTVPTLRLFIVYYYDDFGTYSKVYHSVGGCYLTLGNLPHWQQAKLRNLIPLLLNPPTADKRAAHAVFISQVKELERGVLLDCGPVIGLVWVVGGVGLGKFDMPEGNEAAGLKNHNADYGCRRCYRKRGSLDTFDGTGADRSFQRDLDARAEAAAPGATDGHRDATLQRSGLHARGSLFDGLAMDPVRQTPHDPFHSEFMGMAKKATTNLCKSITRPAMERINKYLLEDMEIPKHWSQRLPAWKLNGAQSKDPGSLKYNGANLEVYAAGRFGPRGHSDRRVLQARQQPVSWCPSEAQTAPG